MKKLLTVLLLLCYAFTVWAQDYQIFIDNGVAKSVSIKGDVFTDRDVSKVINRAISNLQKETGGSIELGSGYFFLNDEITITGWTNNQPPNAQITITGQGYSTQLVQNTKGKNGIVVRNAASIVLKNMYIYAGRNSKAGILFDADENSKASVWGGTIDNIFVQSNSLTDAAVHLKNFFDLNVPHLSVSSSDNHGIILENISKTVSYGNSNFGFIRSVASKAPYAGLFLKSSNANSPINLMTFQNYQCVGSYRGIYSMVSARNVFQLVDIEDAFQPIYLDGSQLGGDTRYTKIMGGYILARDNGTAITNTLYTGGNEINCFVEDDQNRILVSDASQYRPINSYNLQTFGRGAERVDIKSPNIPIRFERVDGSFFDNRNK